MTKVLICCALFLACGSAKETVPLDGAAGSAGDAAAIGDVSVDGQCVRRFVRIGHVDANATSGGLECTVNLPPPTVAVTISVSITTSDGGTIQVPEDPTNGWSYSSDMQSVVFNGSACVDLQAGAQSGVTITYPCGGGRSPPSVCPTRLLPGSPSR